MPIRIPCSCGVTLQVEDRLAGKLVACGKCKSRHNVPGVQSEPPPLPVVRRQPPPLPAEAAPAVEVELYYPKDDSEDADFLVPAPPEIGALRSAHTSLLKTKRPMGLAMRFLLGLLLGVGASSAIAFGLGFSKQVPLETAPFLFYMFAIFIAPLSVVGVLYFTRFRHFIGYTGEKGVAHYRISGSRENVKSAGQFLFQDADYLRVSITDHYYNGGYNGTTFQYDWTDDNNDRIFRFKGTHYHAHKTPPRTSQHLFALAAEVAWSMYLLDMVVTEIQAGRAYTFLLSGEDGICCHKDFVELHQHKGVQRFYPGDLAEVAIKQGVITLKEPNAKEGWFTSTGVHSFSFAQLANAQVFLMLLTRLYGVASNW